MLAWLKVLVCFTLARCQRRSAQGRPPPSSAPDLPRLLRQYLYCCTSKASKLSTCLAALSNAVSPARLQRHNLYFGTSKAGKVRTEDVGNIHVHFRVLQQRVQHTSAYVSIRQHTPAYDSMRQHTLQVCAHTCKRECRTSIQPHSAARIKSVHPIESRYDSPAPHAVYMYICIYIYIYTYIYIYNII